jgi:hypothetical protein
VTFLSAIGFAAMGLVWSPYPCRELEMNKAQPGQRSIALAVGWPNIGIRVSRPSFFPMPLNKPSEGQARRNGVHQALDSLRQGQISGTRDQQKGSVRQAPKETLGHRNPKKITDRVAIVPIWSLHATSATMGKKRKAINDHAVPDDL